jgi:signal peptidase II
MFYIDIWEGRVADWIPLFGGDYMSLWPIFNIADASIFVGVSFILIFQKLFFTDKKSPESESVPDETEFAPDETPVVDEL